MNQLKEFLAKGIFQGLLVIALLAVIMTGVPSNSQAAISEQEAHAIGVQAYTYFYSLMTMDVTRKQLTNVEPGRTSIGGPMNMFNNVPAFPTADMRVVVRPNFDTLYSICVARSHQGADDRLRAGYGMVATISFQCSTCGQTSSRRPAGARRAPRRPISSSSRPAGGPT